MCNEAARRIALGELRNDWSETRIELRFPEGIPNMEPLESVRITDPSIIIRAASTGDKSAELVTRRWSWPGPTGKPVYNFRSDGRSLSSGRCLIPIDSFFEFTEAPVAEGKKKRAPKSKWRFSVRDRQWFCIAGIWRNDPKVGEAWTMLTTEPGADIIPYHNRQIVILPRPTDWAQWLDPQVPSNELCRPLKAGTLIVEKVR